MPALKPHKIIDTPLRKGECYNGMPTIRGQGVSMALTQEHFDEMDRCENNPIYLCEHYLKIVHVDKGLIPFRPWDFQKNIIRSGVKNRYNLVVTARQMGKSTTIAAIIIHYILFNEFKDVAIIANKESTAQEILKRIKLAYEHLPKWLQIGVVKWNEGSIQLENGCSVTACATSSAAIRGKSISLLLIDEAAHIENNLWDDFINSVLPTLSSGTTTRVFMVSTPKGMNHFYTTVKAAREGKNNYVLHEYDWTFRPDRDQKWADSEKAALGSEEKFAQEYCCAFMGSSTTLIRMATLAALAPQTPITFNSNTRIFQYPQPGRTYFATVDVSEGKKQDYSTISVIDITQLPYKQVAVFRSNETSPLMLPNIVFDIATRYNKAWVLIENNSIGYGVVNDLNYELEYENILFVKSEENGVNALGLRTSVRTKMSGCLRLKDMLETEILDLSDSETILELYTFSEYGKSFKADEGKTDDMVMGLVNFAYYSTSHFFEALTDAHFKQKFKQIKQAEVEPDMYMLFIADVQHEANSRNMTEVNMGNGVTINVPVQNMMVLQEDRDFFMD